MEPRITLGSIERLAQESNVRHLGRARFRRKKPGSHVVIVQLPNETRLVETSGKVPRFDPLNAYFDTNIVEGNEDFIDFVEQVLQQERMYLSQVSYSRDRLIMGGMWILPAILRGEIYIEKTKQSDS